MVDSFEISPTYAKDNGLWVLQIDDLIDAKTFIVKERSIVHIPAGEYGGNHKHPRIEAFIGIGDALELVWQDAAHNNHHELMNSEKGLRLFVVHAMTPHIVLNRGTQSAIMFEFADGPQHDVETVNLIN